MTLAQVSTPPQSLAEVVVNRNFETLEHQSVYGQRQSAHSGLTWAYYGGRWGGTSVSDGTVSLTNAATNYLVVNRSTAALSASTSNTNWNDTTNYARVYQITTAGSVVTAVQDHRAGPNGVHGGGSGAGGVSGPGSSTDNTLARWDGTGGTAVQGSGVTLSDSDELHGYRGNVNVQTGTTYTLDVAGTDTDSGKVIDHANASAITVTLPNSAPVGWCCTYVQSGAGQITFSPASGANLRHRQSHTKTAGQWGMVTLYVRTNSGGTAAEYVLGGDTAA